MTALGESMELAVDAHVGGAGEVAPEEVPDTYADLRRIMGSNAAIAEAGGYGRAGEYAVGSSGWERRRAFMRNLQYYEQRDRTPGIIGDELQTIGVNELARRRSNLTRDGVVRAMGRRGVTQELLRVQFAYSRKGTSPRPPREIRASVYMSPDDFDAADWPDEAPTTEHGWEELGLSYLHAFALAYGMPPDVVAQGAMGEYAPVIQFVLGRQEPVDYES